MAPLYNPSGVVISTVDPQSTATGANRGSLFENLTSGRTYRKTDNGSSVNWMDFIPAYDQSILYNVGIAALPSSNNLQISLCTKNVGTPSATDYCQISFGNISGLSGTFNVNTVTGSVSLTVPSGATLGTQNGIPAYLWVYAIDNSGTVELAVSQTFYGDYATITTQTISTSSDLNYPIYSATGRTGVRCRVLGRINISQATAGTWVTNASQIDMWIPGSQPPPIQAVFTQSSGQSIPNGIVTPTVINFDTKVVDTQSCVSTPGGIWIFTAPKTGFYQVNTAILYNSANWAAGTTAYLMAFTSGDIANAYVNFTKWPGLAISADYLGMQGSKQILMSQGQTMNIRTMHSQGGALAIYTTASWNYVDINYVGLA